jgi:hypothetical protein
MQRKLLGIISVGFDVTGQLLIIYSAFIKYLRKNENTTRRCISYLQTSRKHMIQLGRRSCIIFLLEPVSLVYADDVNTLGGSKRTIKKSTEALVIVSKKIGLEETPKKFKYMVMSQDQNAGQNSNIKISNKSFATVEQFKYLGTALTNQNSFHEEIKSRFKSRNACYHSVKDLLPSSLLSKDVKIKIYRTIILHVVMCGCDTWSLTLREECRLMVSENRVLRRLFRCRRDDVTREERRLHNEELYVLYSSPNIIRVIKSRRLRWEGM